MLKVILILEEHIYIEGRERKQENLVRGFLSQKMEVLIAQQEWIQMMGKE